MKLLIIGGTVFLGRSIVESALERGHQVAIFTRGKHNPDLFPQVEKLRGDRRADVTALHARMWDAVIDTCGYFPDDIRTTAQALRDTTQHYTFISTISVYRELEPKAITEESPLGEIEDETTRELTGETYGPLKAACERTVQELYGNRSLVIRPGLIVGPHDPTDRFAYWPRRVAQGGNVLAPGRPEQPVQYIDVRDLAAWTVEMAERQQSGVYNATGPDNPLSMQQFLDACRRTLNPDATFTWVDDAFLLDHEVAPFTELPLWIPAESAGLHMVDCSRAIADGLRFRPLETTIRDTYEWDKAQSAGSPAHPSQAMTAERERELLAAWRNARL